MNNNVGIYIHFPFCKSKCKYCNFNSFANKDNLQLDYFKSMIKEISMYGNKKINIDTIFIGGGTPSLMFDGCISTLISELRKKFNILDGCEITIEGNPNSITQSKVREWKECGVNRVSVGLQTVNSNSLKLIGRTHTKKDYINAIETIKSIGINNINTDCLIGLPKQKLSHVKHTLGLISKLGCTHMSVYSLILEENTPLFDMVERGVVKLPKEEKVLGMYNFAFKYLAEMGFDRYEVSNFAKDGYECKHNLHTWQMREYIGLGAGAHSYYDGFRYCNVDSIEEYIKLVKENNKPLNENEKVNEDGLYEETIMLGLRTKYGINLDEIKTNFGKDLLKDKNEIILDMLNNKLIKIENNNLIATDLGFTVLNKVILELI